MGGGLAAIGHRLWRRRRCALATFEHRVLRVVSCRCRSHPRPLSERLGRGVSVVGAADHLCLTLQTHSVGAIAEAAM
jgi:hypothetical protein